MTTPSLQHQKKISSITFSEYHKREESGSGPRAEHQENDHPMIISKKTRTTKMQYRAQRLYYSRWKKFKYIEPLVTSDGRSTNEVKIRIAQAKKAFQDLSTTPRNKHN